MTDDIATASFGLYCDYVGLKQHFAGQIVWRPGFFDEKIDPLSLVKRSDWRVFISVIEQIGRNRLDNRALLLTMFLHNPAAWIGEVMTPENAARNELRIQRTRRLDEKFFDDLNEISDIACHEEIEFLSYITEGNPPPIIKHFRSGKFAEETGAILHYITGFANIRTGDPLWERRRAILPYYLQFCRNYIDIETAKEVVFETLINNHSNQ